MSPQLCWCQDLPWPPAQQHSCTANLRPVNQRTCGIDLPKLPTTPAPPTTELVSNGQARSVHSAVTMAIEPVIKLLNHLVRLPIGGELETVLGMTLKTGLAGWFLDDGIFFHPLKQSRIDADLFVMHRLTHF